MTRRTEDLRGETEPPVSFRARFSGGCAGELRDWEAEGPAEKELAVGIGR